MTIKYNIQQYMFSLLFLCCSVNAEIIVREVIPHDAEVHEYTTNAGNPINAIKIMPMHQEDLQQGTDGFVAAKQVKKYLTKIIEDRRNFKGFRGVEREYYKKDTLKFNPSSLISQIHSDVIRKYPKYTVYLDVTLEPEGSSSSADVQPEHSSLSKEVIIVFGLDYTDDIEISEDSLFSGDKIIQTYSSPSSSVVNQISVSSSKTSCCKTSCIIPTITAVVGSLATLGVQALFSWSQDFASDDALAEKICNCTV